MFRGSVKSQRVKEEVGRRLGCRPLRSFLARVGDDVTGASCCSLFIRFCMYARIRRIEWLLVFERGCDHCIPHLHKSISILLY